MSPEQMNSNPPLVVGIAPGQHVEVLQTAVSLAARLGTRLLCAYVDEASFLVDWDPARPAHRLSLHPDTDDANIGAVALELKSAIEAAVAGVPPGTAADPADPRRGSRPRPRPARSRKRRADDHRGNL
jgi:hypothetical protein